MPERYAVTAVLVAYASRMGSTAEIASAIGKVLADAGLAVSVRACADVDDADTYDAFVVGSAIYVRRWERDAVKFLERFGALLGERPTWLFQSGPAGEDAATQVVPTPRKVSRLIERFGLKSPKTFAGRLDPAAAKDSISRWVAAGSMSGDFRDWGAIRAWAEECAYQLNAEPTTGLSP